MRTSLGPQTGPVPSNFRERSSKQYQEIIYEAGFVGVGGGPSGAVDWVPTKVTYAQLFHYASKKDYVLMAFAVILATLTGAIQPLYLVCLGIYTRHALELEFNCTTRNETTGMFSGSSKADYEFLLSITCGAMIIGATSHAILMDRAAVNQVRRIEKKYFESIIRKDFTWFDCYIDRDLPHRIHNDMEETRESMGESLTNLIASAVAAISLMSYELYVHTGAATIFICGSPLIAALIYYKARLEKNLIVQEQEEYRQADVLAGEILSSIRTIKLYEAEQTELDRYSSALASVCKLRRSIFSLAFFASLFWIAPSIFIAIVFDVHGQKEYFHSSAEYCKTFANLHDWEVPNQPSVAKLCVVHIGNIYACHELAKALFLFKKIDARRKRAAKVFFVINWSSDIDKFSNSGKRLSRNGENWQGRITFRSVGFTYPRNPQKSVLSGINLTILPGQVITFFGSPRCGKSTIVNLILRLYDPSAGAIFFDEDNAVTLNVNWLRTQFSVAPQETTIFNGTLYDNISLGDKLSTFEEVVQACLEADIHADIISLPEGYNTIVGPTSDVQLTSVQIRGISLARALLSPAPFLVIDDILSNVDKQLEERMLAILRSRKLHSTIILTSSKYNSIVESSDIIYAINANGEIVDQGSPGEMVNRRGSGFHIIQESKEFRSEFKPTFQSQLTAYKFAEAITRKHDRRDEKLARQQRGPGSVGSLSLTKAQSREKLPQPFQSILGFRRYILPRITGGFNSLTLGNTHGINPNHFRTIISSAMLRERDIRVKISRLRNHRFSNRSARILQRSEGEMNIEMTTTELGVQSREQERQVSSKSELPAFHASPKHSSAKSDGIQEAFDTKIKHYYGWMVNSSAGAESISSEDSNAFWNAYSLSLAKALRTRIKFPLLDLVGLTTYSMPYLIFGTITSMAMSVFMVPRAVAITLKFEEHLNVTRKMDTVLTLLFAGLLAIIGVIAFVQELVLGFGLCKSANAMRRSLLRGFLSRDLSWFDMPENDIGFLRDSLAADTVSVQMAFVAWVTTISQILSMFVAMVLLARYFPEWILPWSDIAVLIILFALTVYISLQDGQYKVDLSLAARRAFRQYSELVDEAITNARTIIYLGLEQHFLDEHERRREFATKKLVLFHTFRCFIRSLAYAWKLILLAAIFAIARTSDIAEVDGNGFSIRSFAMTYIVFLTMFTPMGTALASLPTLDVTLAAAAQTVTNINQWKNATRLEDSKMALEIPENAPPPELCFHKASFSFPSVPGNLVLRDFSLTINPGQYVAIVGGGKSTKSCLLDLLSGLYAPDSGSMIVDLWSYRDIKVSSLRKIIGVVKQDPLFREAKISDNIAYGSLERSVSRQEMVEASKMANIRHVIETFPQKYETKLQDLPESASTFALRQRLEIARVWIRNPRVVLVDEATVSINAHNDALLESALQNLRQGRTYVVTSQRIAPIRDADVIVVLDDNGIAEIGMDQELMDRKGMYYDIFTSQQILEARNQADVGKHNLLEAV